MNIEATHYRAEAERYFGQATSDDPRRDPKQDAMLALTCAIFALLERLEEQATRREQLHV